MKTVDEVVAALSGVFTASPDFKDEEFDSMVLHARLARAWAFMTIEQGSRGEVWQWVKKTLEPQQKRTGFERFELTTRRNVPGIGIHVLLQGAIGKAWIVRGATRFCVFSDSTFNSKTIPKASPPMKMKGNVRVRSVGGSSIRANCRSCGESYKEENLLDCPYCGSSYCWRCKGRHVDQCNQE